MNALGDEMSEMLYEWTSVNDWPFFYDGFVGVGLVH